MATIHAISIVVHLWFEVFEWIWPSDEWSLDLPNLQSITLGDSTFFESLSTIIESNLEFRTLIMKIDLPKLNYIELGESVLEGVTENESCSLIMRGTNELWKNDES